MRACCAVLACHACCARCPTPSPDWRGSRLSAWPARSASCERRACCARRPTPFLSALASPAASLFLRPAFPSLALASAGSLLTLPACRRRPTPARPPCSSRCCAMRCGGCWWGAAEAGRRGMSPLARRSCSGYSHGIDQPQFTKQSTATTPLAGGQPQLHPQLRRGLLSTPSPTTGLGSQQLGCEAASQQTVTAVA